MQAHLGMGARSRSGWEGKYLAGGEGGVRRWARPGGAGLTCGEGELDLLLDHLESHEVMFLVEAPIVQQQAVPLLGSKPV